MKENKIRFRVNYAGDVEMTMGLSSSSNCGSPYVISEKFRKKLFETLCNMSVQDELVVHVMLIPHAES